VTKNQERKPRTEYIFGTTKGVVSQLEFTVDQSTGEIGFGPNVGNTYSEVSYDRPKGPKVLSRVPQKGENLTFSADAALKKNYDFLCAVDTNSRVIQGKDVSATAVLIVTPIPQDKGTSWRFDVPFCLEFVELKEPRENFGWVAACEELWRAGKVTNTMRSGMIVDSDLGNINKFNQRKKPLLASFYLPPNLQLLYASSDVGKENVVNKALAIADSISKQTLDAIEKGVAPFNQQRVITPWYEGYRIVEPRNITRTD
jgi:hypothetical protein